VCSRNSAVTELGGALLCMVLKLADYFLEAVELETWRVCRGGGTGSPYTNSIRLRLALEQGKCQPRGRFAVRLAKRLGQASDVCAQGTATLAPTRRLGLPWLLDQPDRRQHGLDVDPELIDPELCPHKPGVLAPGPSRQATIDTIFGYRDTKEVFHAPADLGYPHRPVSHGQDLDHGTLNLAIAKALGR
jgi:hypothetical protein